MDQGPCPISSTSQCETLGWPLPFSAAQLCYHKVRGLEDIPEIPSSSDNLSLCELRLVNLSYQSPRMLINR